MFFSGACCAILNGGYSYQGETGELMLCQRSPGKWDNLAQQDLLYTAVKMSELCLNNQLFDTAKNMLVVFQDPKAVMKARDHTMLLTFDIFPDLAAFSMASIKLCTSKAARPETRGGVPAFNDIAKS